MLWYVDEVGGSEFVIGVFVVIIVEYVVFGGGEFVIELFVGRICVRIVCF